MAGLETNTDSLNYTYYPERFNARTIFLRPRPEVLDQLPRMSRQLAKAADADGQVAHRPGIRERHDGDRHGLGRPACGRLRHDADADVAFHQPAHRVEAAELHAQAQR